MTHYPAFEVALANGDTAEVLRLYEVAMAQRNRAEDLVRGYELALRVQAQERAAVERALEPAGKAVREAAERLPQKSKGPPSASKLNLESI